MLSLPDHSQMSEETEEPSRASGNSKAASQHGEALWKGQPMTSSGTPPLAQAPPQGAAHLGAGGHGDVQVAEDVLRVLVLHRLAQERQGPSWFSAAVPHLHPTTRRELRGGGGVPQATRLAERLLPPKLSRPRSEAGTFTGMARRFSRNDWNWKLRCWAAFLTGTRFPESSANRGVPSSTCREG